MFATYLFVDDVRLDSIRSDPEAGVNRHDSEANVTADPDWPAIEAAIRSLDGRSVRMVLVAERPPEPDTGWPFDGAYLGIGGGGENDLFICKFGETYDVDSSMSRPGDDRDGEFFVMFGCETGFPPRSCFGIDDVLAVARRFAIHGRVPPGYDWDPPLPPKFVDR